MTVPEPPEVDPHAEVRAEGARMIRLMAWVLGGMAALVLALAIYSTTVASSTKSEVTRNYNSAITAVVAAQVENCDNDHKFRVQYKRRGKLDKRLVNLFLTLSHEQVDNPAVPPDQRAQAQAFIKQFGPLAEGLKVIPLPNCGKVAEQLLAKLTRLGVDVTIKDVQRGSEP